jgi:hypothetical protein
MITSFHEPWSKPSGMACTRGKAQFEVLLFLASMSVTAWTAVEVESGVFV